jgi:Integrase core domain
VPFASPNALFNLSKLAVWWLRLGIAIERIRPGHPQQNGRHERMHLTLKKETTRPPGMNSLQQQARFDDFVTEYNTERPQEAVEMKRPADLYTFSGKPYFGLPELDYPLHDREYLVTACGRICMQEDQHLNRAGRSEARPQGGRPRHLAGQLHALRSRIHRPGAKKPATHRQSVRPEVVTQVLGTECYLMCRAGPANSGAGEGIRTLDPNRGNVFCRAETLVTLF